MLQVLGLTAADQQLYERLVAGPPLTQAELASSGWLDPNELTGVLERLHGFGLVSELPGDPPHWTANPPGAALELLISERSRALGEAIGRVAELDAHFQRVAGTRNTPGPIEVIYGRAAIFERFDQLQQSVRYEIRCCEAPPYTQTNPAELNTVELEQMRRGIRYRVLYDRQALELPGRLTDLEAGIRAGEQARVTDVPVKMIMADHSIAILPLHQPADESRLVVYEPLLLDALATLFDVYWERALPLSVSDGRAQLPPHTSGRPSTHETHLLPLLVAGLKDQEIACQLGLSDRTVRSRVHSVLTRLDAATRFQAGYQAVAHGWLAADERDRA